MAEVSQISTDSILEGPFWSEPVKVIAFKQIGRRIQIHASGTVSKKVYEISLTEDQLRNQVRVTNPKQEMNFSGDSGKFRLAIEALRIRLAYEFDPHFAVSVSQIDPLPHQLEAVYHYVLPNRPRIRFLLADDPGAGKTIMAGLLLKELKYRRIIERILIVTPANLTDQWRRELKEKFGEIFQVVNRGTVDSLYGRNLWDESPQCITSIDFAKKEGIIDAMRETHWDLVIVDEAHKMSAYIYGEERKESERYKLGKLLSLNADHLLMLTATPHKGDPDNFRLLMQLLDREMFESPASLDVALHRKEAPLFLRRMKEDMVKFDGTKIFTQRHVVTTTFTLSPREQELYDAVTKYVENQSARAVTEGKRGRMIGFALALLQRRLASSVRAIRRSLERRFDRLNSLTERIDQIQEEIDVPEDMEEWTEEERWMFEKRVEGVTFARTKEELQWELGELENLIKLAKDAEKAETETKLSKLRELLTDQGFFQSKIKLLIFTEHKDTLDYLVEKLKGWGFALTQIHGGMRLEQRIEAEREFREQAQILVATEAAGEGINLQFCWVMVNYDIPWNPNRLEQRMGRIHRYLQTKDCQVFNLVAEDTREGQVLKRLLEKIEEIRKAMGSDKVYDVISDIIPGASLDKLFREALAKQRTWKEVMEFVEKNLSPERVATIREATLEGLATRHIDLAGLIEEDRRAREQRLMPEYIRQFFFEAFSAVAGAIKVIDDGLYKIDRVPLELRQTPQSLQKQFGPVEKEYKKLTFLKEILEKDSEAELIGPGHPLFEAVVDWIISNYASQLQQGAVFHNPDIKSPSLVTFWHVKVQDGRGQMVGGRLLAVEVSGNGKLTYISPSLLIDCKPSSNPDVKSEMPFNSVNEDMIIGWAYDNVFDPYLDEIRNRRERELIIAERHIKVSLDALIAESQSKLLSYKRRQERGEDMLRAIGNEETRKRDLEERQRRRLQEISLERNLSLTNPELLGTALILPLVQKHGDAEMQRDEEVERIAMQHVMEYERRQGRSPLDVSAQNLGFDVRSEDSSKKSMYIEVKGRAGVGAVALTPNEKIIAERFGGDYWLYIVTNTKTKPELSLVQDPAKNIPMMEEHEIVRYVIPLEVWKKVAKPVDGVGR